VIAEIPIEHLIGNVPVDGLCDLIDELDNEASGKDVGVTAGWREFSDQMGGLLRQGQMSVMAGPPGNGKSYWAMACCLFAEVSGFSWRYLPLEDTQKDWIRRMAAIVCNDWGMLDPKQAKDNMQKIVDNKEILKVMQEGMCENPRKPMKGSDGRPMVPDIPYDKVADWIYRAGQDIDLLVIDPISIIDYDTGNDKTDWQGQKEFIKQVSGYLTDMKAHVLLISHTTKRKSRSEPLHMDKVEGSQSFSKFCHNVLLLDCHEVKESMVYGAVGGSVSHNRTLMIEKARSSKGGGTHIAMDLDRSGPVFSEYGVINPNG